MEAKLTQLRHKAVQPPSGLLANIWSMQNSGKLSICVCMHRAVNSHPSYADCLCWFAVLGQCLDTEVK